MIMSFVVFAVGGYLLGAIPFAVAASKLFNLPDPRHSGSGNPGATNIARGGNKTVAILTLFADIGKGAGAVFLASHFSSPTVAAVAGLAAVVGHIFSPFLRFSGGKGVAAAVGVFAVWDWQIGLAAGAVWLLVFAVGRTSSLSSLAAVVVAAATFAAISSTANAVAATLIAALVVYRHRPNIVRLLRREENQFR